MCLCLEYDLFVRYVCCVCVCLLFCFFQAEDGIRYLVRSRGLGDVYKRQGHIAVFVEMDLSLADGGSRRLAVIAKPLNDIHEVSLSLIHI